MAITIDDTRKLTLYLVDCDGMPVRAADEDDLAKAGFVAEHLFSGAIKTSEDWQAKADAWAAQCNMASEAQSDALDNMAKLLRELDIAQGDRATFANCIDAIAKVLGVDSCALLEDPSIAGRRVSAPVDVEEFNYVAAQAAEAAQDANDLAKELRALKSRIADLESRPLSPEVARVVEAAKKWARCDVRDELDAASELSAAVGALPSPLPVVVTCGECEHRIDDRDRLNCTYLLEYRKNGYCHIGRRRSEP